MSRPILSRKPDLLILIFFSLHIFFVTFVDCLDLWPEWLSTSPYIPFFTAGRLLRDFYLQKYQDKFLVEQPGWFVVFTWCELGFHLPVCLWVVRGLWNGIIPWTVETFFTTLLCVVEIWKWDDRSEAIKWGLTGCYGPYLLISALLFVVMYGKVKEALLLQRQQQVKAKGQ
ncbi:integral membrane protein, putative [Talaromyces stipitatus ATCC 10500]|uniref:Efficient mitochondria targeting-associated protein 19 n=1 Tax=Talaromyces stipitatus (strain ATCC 10500 / CBS 375.48 / QM 6759 / NRRL 1006) TaxID=441959 RepID=B8M3V1_TALSN|nr:integral membrane protein, putative [Talaromyces stipitatus ATCC 10500]EED20694.1 integral membrane protein, putative [Talaromyces stipitatus ATCC 10500]